MPGKEIRNIEDRNVHDFYMDACQDYGSRKRKIVKTARKWNAPTNKPKEFKFSANTNQNIPPIGVFVFGSAPQGRTRANASSFAPQETPSYQEPVENQAQNAKSPGRWSVSGKFRVETKESQDSNYKGHSVKKRSETAATPTKSKAYKLRDQELKMEAGE